MHQQLARILVASPCGRSRMYPAAVVRPPERPLRFFAPPVAHVGPRRVPVAILAGLANLPPASPRGPLGRSPSYRRRRPRHCGHRLVLPTPLLTTLSLPLPGILAEAGLARGNSAVVRVIAVPIEIAHWFGLATHRASLPPDTIAENIAGMDLPVLRGSHQLQVLDPIVSLVAIDVVDLHAVRDGTTVPLPYQTVLKDRPPAYPTNLRTMQPYSPLFVHVFTPSIPFLRGKQTKTGLPTVPAALGGVYGPGST